MPKALLILAILASTSCAHVQPLIDAGKACADEANAATANQAIPKVNEALGCALADTSDLPDCVVAGLQDLGKVWGSAALQCALEKIAGSMSAEPGDTAAPVRRRRAAAALKQTRVSWNWWSDVGRTAIAVAPPGFGPGTGGGG